MQQRSKIYIAGHKGLVGSAIWRGLEAKGYTNLLGRTHQEFDLEDRALVKSFFDTQRPEYVILAAAHVGGIMANNRYRADFIYKNLQIQQNIIAESYLHNVKKLIFLGSTCIYPRNAPQPISEEALLTSELEYTNEPYAIAKIAGLKMCESFNIQYETNYIAVMPTNLYGPNDNFDLENSHVLPAMLRKIHLAKCLGEDNWADIRHDIGLRPIGAVNAESSESDIVNQLDRYGISHNHVTLWGSGAPLREFLWSEDMADATIHIMERVDFEDLKPCDTDDIRNTHINIGTGKEVTIKELSAIIAKVTHFKGEIIFDKSKPDGTMRKLTNVEKLHSLGWRHKIEIEQGVEMIYSWYLSQ